VRKNDTRFFGQVGVEETVIRIRAMHVGMAFNAREAREISVGSD
jgi:hypothetical protein